MAFLLFFSLQDLIVSWGGFCFFALCFSEPRRPYRCRPESDRLLLLPLCCCPRGLPPAVLWVSAAVFTGLSASALIPVLVQESSFPDTSDDGSPLSKTLPRLLVSLNGSRSPCGLVPDPSDLVSSDPWHSLFS